MLLRHSQRLTLSQKLVRGVPGGLPWGGVDGIHQHAHDSPVGTYELILPCNTCNGSFGFFVSSVVLCTYVFVLIPVMVYGAFGELVS